MGQRPAGCKQQRSRRWEPQPGCEAPIGKPGSSALDEKGPVKNKKGVNYKIRRGVEVEVPPEVAEVLEHSQQQDEYTAARIAAAETAAQ